MAMFFNAINGIIIFFLIKKYQENVSKANRALAIDKTLR